LFRKSSRSRCQFLDSILAVAGVPTPPAAPELPAAGNGTAKSVLARAASAAGPAIKRKPSESLGGPERKTQRQDLAGKKGPSGKEKQSGSGKENKAGPEAAGSKAGSKTDNVKTTAKEEIKTKDEAKVKEETKAKPAVGPSLPVVRNS
jgi:hypothetical protein